MAVSDFENPDLWRQDLDKRWPERMVMKDHLLRYLSVELADRANPVLLELGIGDGELLAALLERLPEAHFVAMDNNRTLLDYCNVRLRTERVSAAFQDLTSSWAEPYAGTFDAVYTLQSIHDLGDATMLNSTYKETLMALKPGGVMINADFVVPLPQDMNAVQRRFPVAEHLRVLKACGFQKCFSVHEEGLLGCVVATKPG